MLEGESQRRMSRVQSDSQNVKNRQIEKERDGWANFRLVVAWCSKQIMRSNGEFLGNVEVSSTNGFKKTVSKALFLPYYFGKKVLWIFIVGKRLLWCPRLIWNICPNIMKAQDMREFSKALLE